jgi:UDP:flavonoid glycosyltransferase YjiC (YdhE family)
MKVALAGYGSRGDVEPCAAVARELLRRGHDVCMAVPPNLLGFVESAGLAAVAFGPDAPEPSAEKIQNPVNAMLGAMQHLTQAMTQWGTTLTALADGADLLLTGEGEQGLAANVAEYYGIPLATLHFFPGEHPGLSGVIGHVTKQAEDAQRRALGLPDTTGPSSAPMAERGSLEIQAYDARCFPELAAEWAEQGGLRPFRPFVGALTLEVPTEADDEVLSWIAEGTPPIYFGFGSNVRLPYPAETVAVISAACEQLGERALFCSGASDFIGVPDFDNVKVVSAVNHAAIFPACRAVVHQGGAGTTAAGMRAGVPTLILWHQIDDQPIWAAVVGQLKVGAGRAFSASTLDSLVADLRSILAPQCVTRAREVAAQLTKPAESVASVVDLLEDAVRLGRVDA